MPLAATQHLHFSIWGEIPTTEVKGCSLLCIPYQEGIRSISHDAYL